MTQAMAKLAIIAGMLGFLLLLSEPAHALRCGTRIVMEGMDESEVIRLCGEPVSTRHVGYVLRSGYRSRYGRYTVYSQRDGYGYSYLEELEVTEMLFNFGPRKLMRRIRFEGGRLAKIETAGYGYLDTDR